MTGHGIEMRFSPGGRRFLAQTWTPPDDDAAVLGGAAVDAIIEEFTPSLLAGARPRFRFWPAAVERHTGLDGSACDEQLFAMLTRIKALPLTATDAEAIAAMETAAKAHLAATAHPVSPTDYPEPRHTQLASLFAALRDIRRDAQAIEDAHIRRSRLPVLAR